MQEFLGQPVAIDLHASDVVRVVADFGAPIEGYTSVEVLPLGAA